MPQPPDWKHVLETGQNFTEVHRSQAQKIASDLVSQGQLARDQLGAAVDEIVETSRKRSEELRKVVRAEVKRQLEALHLSGVVPFALDDEPKRRTGAPKKSTAKKPAKKPGKATKKTAKKAAKKPAAKKPAAKKPAAKKAAKKPAAKKPAAKKAGKAAAKQATKTPAKKAAKAPAARAG